MSDGMAIPPPGYTHGDVTLTETATMDGGPHFEVSLAPDLAALAPMRREAAERLAARGITPSTVEDVLLVLCELCSNAIQATRPRDAPVLARVHLGEAAIMIEVENAGQSFDALNALAEGHGGAATERGRGLLIVRALSDSMTVQFHDGRCIVQAVMSLP